jgi:hypothetical protein
MRPGMTFGTFPKVRSYEYDVVLDHRPRTDVEASRQDEPFAK